MDKFTINVKDGFYVGDLCYVLSDEVYHGVWGANNYKIGKYEHDGKEFAMVNTEYGDGCYYGSDGFDYPVDAGIIGICDKDLVEKDSYGYGRLVNYSGQVRITYDDDGTIYITFGIGTITIPTGDTDDDGYEDEDDNDNWW